MDSNDFFQGLVPEAEKTEESIAGMEHFIRLKKLAGIQKRAYEIQPSERTDIPKGDFAQPHKEEAGHEGKYPIPDRQHARSALGFAKMHHDSAALSAVRHKVEQKYPDMLHEGHEKDAIMEKCEGCGMSKEACPCGYKSKMAGALGDAFRGFKSGLKYEQFGAGSAVQGLKHPHMRAHSGGRLVGHATPAIAAGAIGHAIGAHGQDKTATSAEFDELQGNQEMRPYEERMGRVLAGVRDKLERNEKTAGIREAIKNVDPALIGPVAGGTALGGLLTYLGSRPHDELKGKSKAEHQLEQAVRGEKEENGLLDKLHNRTTEMQHGYAKAFREHPGKASLMGAGMGAAAGYGIGRLAGARSLIGGIK